MKLKTVERITMVGAILVALSFLLVYSGFRPELTQIFLWVAVGLTLALLIFSVIFNRCPKCGVYLWRTGDFCSSCGEHLEKYR